MLGFNFTVGAIEEGRVVKQKLAESTPQVINYQASFNVNSAGQVMAEPHFIQGQPPGGLHSKSLATRWMSFGQPLETLRGN